MTLPSECHRNQDSTDQFYYYLLLSSFAELMQIVASVSWGAGLSLCSLPVSFKQFVTHWLFSFSFFFTILYKQIEVSSVLIMMGLLGWIIRIADVTDVHPENKILVLSGFLRRDTSGSFAHCQDVFFSLLILLVSWVWFVITKQTKRTSLFHDMFFLFLTEHDNVFLSETSLKLKEYRVCSLAPTSLLSLK